ncbi:hypothetical protein COCSADRAFT_232617 [Bipolaris sorokiniana ND90Pr]|uniref:Uncharacterized protein n=1 Tax=Cochliobolus sativus (strain ND90Pr / ATCC 201652) TaxID=665912 RepID=M2S2Y8_COCSN|nr:uncharacterized protein COCSADRAFT_232617 [Bipolaris sorokiniana ND90Pr]EMD61548.1 hypothetical protein COCSADRAFT_232617 [Bipolaris sorokiniana ND90Pr]
MTPLPVRLEDYSNEIFRHASVYPMAVSVLLVYREAHAISDRNAYQHIVHTNPTKRRKYTTDSRNGN